MVRFGALIAAIVVVLDQVSKAWLLAAFLPYGAAARPTVEVSPFLNLVLVWNSGVSFGMFSDHASYGPYLLSAVALAISLVLGVWLWRVERRWLAAALAMTIGGALGNVIDRLRLGAVVDFIDFHVFGWHWPAFNVADAAITLGVIGMVLVTLLDKPRTTKVEAS